MTRESTVGRPAWDPARYLTYADERGRPFVELLTRVRAEEPSGVGSVVDLGCGPGTLTALLAERWPGAEVTGLDSSPEMVDAARSSRDGASELAGGRVCYEVADLRDWVAGVPPGSVDVVVSNATLQWVPGHLELLPALAGAVRPGGWLAFSVPANFSEPSHTVRHALEAEAPYAAHLADIARPASHDAATYLRVLDESEAQMSEIDAWETTCLHVLEGEDPVLRWISGTSARPALQALEAAGGGLRERFEAELARRLAAAYPAESGRVLMPFRRVFVVCRRVP